MTLFNDLYRTTVGGLVGLTLIAGCERSAGSDYNRTVGMPTDCKTVISAGSSTALTSQGSTANLDWVSCFDYSGNVVIHRMPKNDDKWYSTVIQPHKGYGQE